MQVRFYLFVSQIYDTHRQRQAHTLRNDIAVAIEEQRNFLFLARLVMGKAAARKCISNISNIIKSKRKTLATNLTKVLDNELSGQHIRQQQQ